MTLCRHCSKGSSGYFKYPRQPLSSFFSLSHVLQKYNPWYSTQILPQFSGKPVLAKLPLMTPYTIHNASMAISLPGIRNWQIREATWLTASTRSTVLFLVANFKDLFRIPRSNNTMSYADAAARGAKQSPEDVSIPQLIVPFLSPCHARYYT